MKNHFISFRYTISVVGISLIYVILIASLFWFYDKEKFVEILSSDRTLYSLKLSLICATVVALISTILAIPAAYALSRYNFPLKNVMDTLLELPMIVSPAALGAMILIFFNTRYGSYIQEHSVQVVFSIAGILIAQLVTILGISIRLIKAVMDEIPLRYEHIARTLGATQWKAFRTVTLPLAKKGILAAYLLAWAKAIGEFGATITVAGSMPLKTETLPTAIYLRLASADIEGSVVLILIIVAIGIFTLTIFRLLGHSKIV